MPFKPKTFLVEIDHHHHAIEIPIPFRSVPAHADDDGFDVGGSRNRSRTSNRAIDAVDAGDDAEGGTAAGGRRETIIGDAPSAIITRMRAK